MRVISLFFFFIFFLNTTSTSENPYDYRITAIGWNGEYWLLATGEGDIVKYDGKEFLYLINLGCIPMEIEWFKNNWIMSCRRPVDYWLKPDDRLVRYDGENFVYISKDYAPQIIRCNEEYCLMFGSAKDERIMKYDGEKLIDLTEESSKVSLVPWIQDIVWNGEYWLITTDNLIKYDGDTFSRIDIGKLSLLTLDWNGEYWLIVLGEKQNITVGYKPRIFKYDGKMLTELTLPSFFDVRGLKVEGQGYLIPNKMVWNGNYWLMNTSFSKLIKYDGKIFEEIALSRKSAGIHDIAWNGEYWLVSYLVAPGVFRMAKYDGQNFSEIDFPEYAMLSLLGWNGEYWLIGTSYSEPFGMLRYDGNTFKDLTDDFMTTVNPTFFQKYGFVISIFISLIVIFIFLWRKSKR